MGYDCMRELKFRAWIISEKKLAKVHSLHLNKKSIIISYSTDYGAGGNRSVTSDDYILEQYTGMRDCYGKEIYEGDIVKVIRNNEGESDYFTTDIETVLEPSWMELEPIYSGGEDTWWEIESLEVIGNIHENPELLE
jgi:uncharacterized phage protein (TIGR01671 family)